MHFRLLAQQSATVKLCAFVVLSNGKNGTIGRQIPRAFVVFPVVKMVPLVDKFRSRFYQWYHW